MALAPAFFDGFGRCFGYGEHAVEPGDFQQFAQRRAEIAKHQAAVGPGAELFVQHHNDADKLA